MKANSLTGLILLVMIIFMGACGEGSTYDELPGPIAKFVTQYFPFGEVTGYDIEKNGSSTVQIRNGATLKFDSDYDWTDINGNGETLPPTFLYDQLAPTLYDYIESIEMTNDVYRVTRTDKGVKVELHDTWVEYVDATGELIYPEEDAKSA